MTPESDARDGRIPVLDIAPTLAQLPGAAEALADRIARTCQDTGFLVLTGHWVAAMSRTGMRPSRASLCVVMPLSVRGGANTARAGPPGYSAAIRAGSRTTCFRS